MLEDTIRQMLVHIQARAYALNSTRILGALLDFDKCTGRRISAKD